MTGNGNDIVTGASSANLRAWIRIETGAGEDLVRLEGFVVQGNVTINSGETKDLVILQESSISGKLGIWAGRGDDAVHINTNVTSKVASLGGGDGNDTLRIGEEGVDLGETHITGFETQTDV